MEEFLGWLLLLLLSQWFFGNLYEAVVFVPNFMMFFKSASSSGEALFRSKRRSPVAYYVPAISLAGLIALGLAATSLRKHSPATGHIVACCVFLFVGIGITIYVVRDVNLDLFFTPQQDLSRTRRLLSTWTLLNYLRLPVAAGSIVTLMLWLRANFRY